MATYYYFPRKACLGNY